MIEESASPSRSEVCPDTNTDKGEHTKQHRVGTPGTFQVGVEKGVSHSLGTATRAIESGKCMPQAFRHEP